MKEQRESVVDIKDATMTDVYQLVLYMYAGRIEEEYKSYRELLKLADKYGVLELSNVCGNKLAETLTNENALELGIFGDTHNSNTLIKKAAEFIHQHQKECLNIKDYMDRIRGGPNLMAHIIQIMVVKKEREDEKDSKSKTTVKERRLLYRAVQRAIDDIPNRYVSCCKDASMSTADVRAALDSLASKGIIEWRHDQEAFKIKKVDLD